MTPSQDRALLDELDSTRGALVTVAQWDPWAAEWLAKHPLRTALVDSDGLDAARETELEERLTATDQWLVFLVAHAEHVHGCEHTGQLRAALDLTAHPPHRASGSQEDRTNG